MDGLVMGEMEGVEEGWIGGGTDGGDGRGMDW